MKIHMVFARGVDGTLRLLNNTGKVDCTCGKAKLGFAHDETVNESSQVRKQAHQLVEDDVCAVSWIKIKWLEKKLPQWGVKV